MISLDLSEYTKVIPEKKVGYVALIGRPNSGKSTFINTLIHEKISAVSNKPQTTQKTIKGIYNDDDSQIIFFDTPGIHESKEAMNIIINAQAINSLKDADIVVRFIDISRPYGEEEVAIAKLLENVNKPIITVYSKTDISCKERTVKVPKDSEAEPITPPTVVNPFFVSSEQKTGLEVLVQEIKKHLVMGPLFYSEDYYTDQDMETRIREVIREKLFLLLEDEIPYDTFVEIEEIEEKGDLLKILAVVHVEKDSQKTIIIGKRAEKLQEIGTLARKDLEKIFERKVFLLVRVKTHPHWKKNKGILKRHFM